MNEQTFSDENFRTAFIMSDREKDGFITIKELKEILTNVGQTPSDAELQDLLNDADIDENGKFNYIEFKTMIERKLTGSDTEEELIEAFKSFDKDGNGLVSSGDLLRVMYALGERLSSEEVDEMVREYDMDEDGYLNFDEFWRMMANR